jgi:endoglucanase
LLIWQLSVIFHSFIGNSRASEWQERFYFQVPKTPWRCNKCLWVSLNSCQICQRGIIKTISTMDNNKTEPNSLRRHLLFQRLRAATSAAIVIVAVTGVGVYILAPSHAAAPTTGISAGSGAPGTDQDSCSMPSGTFAIGVCGNRFVNQTGTTVVLRGANIVGTQYDCAQAGAGFYDDSTITPGVGGNPGTYTTEINALKTWGVNAVRINLNEECWLGINGVPATTSATAGSVPAGDTYNTKTNAYMTEMGNYVKALNAAGIYTELVLNLNAPGNELITDAGIDAQNPLPESNSDMFWKSVASYFKSNHAVIFGVFNEPFPPSAKADGGNPAGWACVVHGCTVPDYTSENANQYGSLLPTATYTGVGAEQLITDIRQYNTAAPLLVGGPDFAGDLDDWLGAFYPNGKSIDPENELAASVHIYYPSGDSPCSGAVDSVKDNGTCAGAVTGIAQTVPVMIDELGDFTCSANASTSTDLAPFIQSIDAEDAAASIDIGYMGWAWTTASCDPNLITSFTTGAPTNMGAAFYCELLNGTPKTAQPTFAAACTGPNPK